MYKKDLENKKEKLRQTDDKDHCALGSQELSKLIVLVLKREGRRKRK